MDDLLQTLTDLVLENKNKVVLNFRQVKHVSLNAISKLAERSVRFKGLGGEIKLSCLIPYVANLFKLVGAYSCFDVVPDEEEAVARFES
jgi:anti-anti-sigma regulatory factor